MPFRFASCQVLSIQIFGLKISLFLLTLPGFSQRLTPLDTTVYTVVEHQPEFPGGWPGLKTYLQQNVRYPPDAQKARIKGRVYVSFIVEKNGSITDIQVFQGIGHGCDEEARRVIKAMPRWKPGSQSGPSGEVILRVKYSLPIFFGIDYTYYPRTIKY